MSALRFLDDEAIEAITLGDDVVAELSTLSSFADLVRAEGDRPAPRPNLELQSLFVPRAEPTTVMPMLAVASTERLAAVARKVAGIGIAAKLALGVSLATAGVAGAAATGALPDGADRAVRHAIEVVTPLTLPEPGEQGPPSTLTSTTEGHQGDAGPSAENGSGGSAEDRADDDRGEGGGKGSGDDRDDRGRGRGKKHGRGQGQDEGNGPDADDQGTDPTHPTIPTTTAVPDEPGAAMNETTTETAPASAPGQSPDAAGDEGTAPRQAWDADAAGSTG